MYIIDFEIPPYSVVGAENDVLLNGRKVRGKCGVVAFSGDWRDSVGRAGARFVLPLTYMLNRFPHLEKQNTLSRFFVRIHRHLAHSSDQLIRESKKARLFLCSFIRKVTASE